MTSPLDVTALCREAERLSALMGGHVAEADRTAEWCALLNVPQRVVLSVADARSLASLLTQLATLARAAGART